MRPTPGLALALALALPLTACETSVGTTVVDEPAVAFRQTFTGASLLAPSPQGAAGVHGLDPEAADTLYALGEGDLRIGGELVAEGVRVDGRAAAREHWVYVARTVGRLPDDDLAHDLDVELTLGTIARPSPAPEVFVAAVADLPRAVETRGGTLAVTVAGTPLDRLATLRRLGELPRGLRELEIASLPLNDVGGGREVVVVILLRVPADVSYEAVVEELVVTAWEG